MNDDHSSILPTMFVPSMHEHLNCGLLSLLDLSFVDQNWSEERLSDAKAKATATAGFGFDLFVGNIPFSVSEKVKK